MLGLFDLKRFIYFGCIWSVERWQHLHLYSLLWGTI